MNFHPPSEKQARVIWIAVTGVAVAVIIGLIIALVWGLEQVVRVLRPVIWPLAIALVLSYLLDPVVDWLERRRVPRTRGVLLVFLLAVMLMVGLLGSVVPQIVVEIKQLAGQIPQYAQKVEAAANDWITHPPSGVKRLLDRYLPIHRDTTDAASDTNAPAATNQVGAALPASTNTPAASARGTNVAVLIQVFGGSGTNSVMLAVPSVATPDTPMAGASPFASLLTVENVKSAGSFVSTATAAVMSWLFGQAGKVTSLFGVLFGVVAGLVLVPIYLFYFLVEKRGIASNWTAYLPVRDSCFKEELVFVLRAINDYLIAFFRGQVLVAICDSVLYTTGFFLIGLPYATLLGVMAMFLTIIPFIGAITICLSALVLALVSFGDWMHPLLVLLVFGIVQALEGLVISPKIMGNRVGLHPLVIIVALMVGTTLLGGILGGILAIPLAAALRVIMFRYVWKKRDA